MLDYRGQSKSTRQVQLLSILVLTLLRDIDMDD